MHPLKQYLNDVDEPMQDFARRVGVSRQTLYRIISGRQAPKPALAKRIVEATGRVVEFEMLYKIADQEISVVDIGNHHEAPPLNQARLKSALAIVVNHLTADSPLSPPEEAIDIAAEAVLNTYVALSTVTTRQGPNRLRQALRPVLGEILREYSERVPDALLDQGAALATQYYFQNR